jgi:hypothetical protein
MLSEFIRCVGSSFSAAGPEALCELEIIPFAWCHSTILNNSLVDQNGNGMAIVLR